MVGLHQTIRIIDEENNILVDGALLIDVHLQSKPESSSIHVPSNYFGKNMLKLLENEDDANVSFKVKKTIIPANKLILKMNAPILFGFVRDKKRVPSPRSKKQP